MMDLSVVPYGEMRRSKEGEVGGGVGEPAGGRYRECMRNHAAAIGGQAYDGCGEFMPGGDSGSLEALKCAACGCHRNFHRRDGFLGDKRRPLFLAWDGKKPIPSPPPPPPPPPGFPAFFPPPLPYHQIPLPPPPQAAPVAAYQGFDRSRVGSETPPRRDEVADGGDGARSSMRKRYRTKFTAEQKEKMQAFAEKLGWRIQKHDDVALQEFCVEVGVKRHVLRVWMHNNKNHLSSSAAAAGGDAAAKPDPASAAPISV